MSLQKKNAAVRPRGGPKTKGALLFGVALGLVLFVALQGMAVGDVTLPWAVAVIVGSRLAADVVAGILVVYVLRVIFEASHFSLAQSRVWLSGMRAPRPLHSDAAAPEDHKS